MEDQNTPHLRRRPADAFPTKISLAKRAPTGPIPTRTWLIFLRVKDWAVEYKDHLGQETIVSGLRSRTLLHELGLL